MRCSFNKHHDVHFANTVTKVKKIDIINIAIDKHFLDIIKKCFYIDIFIISNLKKQVGISKLQLKYCIFEKLLDDLCKYE